MGLNITKDTVFYILAPADVDTGGPHDLHQLACELKDQGKKVYMYYFPENQKEPVHKNYKVYNLPFTNKIEDMKKNVLERLILGAKMVPKGSKKEVQKSIRKTSRFLPVLAQF